MNPVGNQVRFLAGLRRRLHRPAALPGIWPSNHGGQQTGQQQAHGSRFRDGCSIVERQAVDRGARTGGENDWGTEFMPVQKVLPIPTSINTFPGIETPKTSLLARTACCVGWKEGMNFDKQETSICQ
jgi:hypothetical protein